MSTSAAAHPRRSPRALGHFAHHANMTMKTFLNVILLYAIAGCCSPDKPGDRRAEELAVSSAEYPLAGFWKEQATNDWGMAIAPVRNGRYSISFCGQGGCFEPGTYRSNSKIYGDKWYKVIDANTIEIRDRDGRFDPYYRFESRTSTNRIVVIMTWPNQALQRTRPSRPGCKRTPSWAGSLSLGRSAPFSVPV